MGIAPRYFRHDASCCGRDPIAGATYRRRKLDIITGQLGEYDLFQVMHVEPIDLTKMFCRRVHIKSLEDGRVFKPQVAGFWADRYEAIGNVVALTTHKPPPHRRNERRE